MSYLKKVTLERATAALKSNMTFSWACNAGGNSFFKDDDAWKSAIDERCTSCLEMQQCMGAFRPIFEEKEG